MTPRLDFVVQQRLEKLDRIRARGINPYPYDYHRSHTAQQAIALLKQQEDSGKVETSVVSVAGRIMANRPMGKISFLDIRDSSEKIQACFRKDRLSEQNLELLKDIDIGDIIGVSGKLFRTKTGEPTIEVEDFTLLAKSLQPLPEKWHGLSDVDKRYRQRYLDLISNPETKETFRVRSQVITAIRQFLNQRGFLEVETPVLQPSAGGALARPFTTHHHTLDQDFYLRIAHELHLKRLIIGGFDKVYELGRTFRNEGISIKHNPEFTMLESYEAYTDYNDVMNMVEKMVSEISQQVLGTNKVEFGDNTLSLKPPWQRLELRQAIIKYSGIDFDQYPDIDSLRTKMLQLKMEVDPQKDRGRLIDELISTFVEPNMTQPTFLVDYPIEMSPLAKAKPDDDHLVERFEAFAGGMEIANAFTELNDPLEQRQRFLQQQKERQPENEEVETTDEDFLLALEYGMPPAGGLGIGIDRLVMLLTNQQSIREVILFPQLVGIDVGAEAIDRSFNQGAGYTILSLDNPANADGIIEKVTVFAQQNITGLVVGTFFLVNGTTYQCRDSDSIGSVTSGSKQTFTGLDIAVKAGDIIGAWWTGGYFEADTSGYAGFMYAADKHINPGDQVAYTLRTGAAISLYGAGWRSPISRFGRV